MNKDRIKALFFDLDHTLWDFETNSELALRKLFQTYQLELPFDVFLEVYVPNNFCIGSYIEKEKLINKHFVLNA